MAILSNYLLRASQMINYKLGNYDTEAIGSQWILNFLSIMDFR